MVPKLNIACLETNDGKYVFDFYKYHRHAHYLYGSLSITIFKL